MSYYRVTSVPRGPGADAAEPLSTDRDLSAVHGVTPHPSVEGHEASSCDRDPSPRYRDGRLISSHLGPDSSKGPTQEELFCCFVVCTRKYPSATGGTVPRTLPEPLRSPRHVKTRGLYTWCSGTTCRRSLSVGVVSVGEEVRRRTTRLFYVFVPLLRCTLKACQDPKSGSHSKFLTCSVYAPWTTSLTRRIVVSPRRSSRRSGRPF